MKKRILLLTTGGTIVSEQTGTGFEPNSSHGLLDLLDAQTRMFYEISQYNLFSLDSSNIQPEEWQSIAQTVFDAMGRYEGIVITHGTDTLAYTASMLSFMLQNIEIPVVITGSQLPLSHPLSDAAINLRTAFTMAGSGAHGIFVAFNRKIITGCRAVKVRTSGFDAFECINAPLAGYIDTGGLHINPAAIHAASGSPCLKKELDPRVFLLKLTPATDPEVLQLLADAGYQGIVIEAFGIGGLPLIRRRFPDVIGKVSKRIPVVICSQCLYEPCDLSLYQVGLQAVEQGAWPAFDMTTEAVVTKLIWILGQTKELSEVKKLLFTDIAGELNAEVTGE